MPDPGAASYACRPPGSAAGRTTDSGCPLIRIIKRTVSLLLPHHGDEPHLDDVLLTHLSLIGLAQQNQLLHSALGTDR